MAHGLIAADDEEVYTYSFEILLSTFANFLALTFLSVITRTVPESALYLLGFAPLRQIAGGYHAKNHFRCFLILMCSYAVFLLLLLYLPVDVQFPVIVTSVLLSVVYVFLFAPAEDANKPLSYEEKVRFKKKSRCFIAGYAATIGLLTGFVPDKKFVFSLAMGVFTAAISLMANFIRYENGKQREQEGGGV
jgi:accessory gene regulator B